MKADRGQRVHAANGVVGGHGISRRDLLRAGAAGAGAAVLQSSLAAPVMASAGQAESAARPNSTALRLDSIQGNVLAGFNKDHQRFLFFQVGDGARARAWLAAIADQIASASEVLAFNDLYRRATSKGRASPPSVVWVNVALTFSGLRSLGVSTADLTSFPDAFAQGMRARAGIIGDVGDSAPAGWIGPFGAPSLHGVLIIAGDRQEDLDVEVDAQTSAMSRARIRVLLDQAGHVRADEPGHEHFGFKDGISQPGIRGLTPSSDPGEPDQGVPGQELLWPGEFVLGYPTQIPTPASGDDNENHDPGPISSSGPAWTADGSFMVLRRLRQDVAGFRAFVAKASNTTGLDPELLEAKIVGRYRSGAPLERTADQAPGFDTQAGDPSLADPSLLTGERINNFEFGGDPDGYVVPRAAHIRKVYPRDEVTPTGGEAATQTHRIIRRGIPFGVSYDPAAPAGAPSSGQARYPDDRGLLFVCYQASIERQFEFIQRRWVNDADFPERGDGQDPVIAQASPRKTFTVPGEVTSHRLMMANFVTTTGGEYFLQPSIDALRLLSRGGAPGNG